METPYPPCPVSAEWQTLYRAAILERNKNLIPQKVSAAETAIRARAKELFGTFGGDEKESLQNALYALHALKTALEHTEAA